MKTTLKVLGMSCLLVAPLALAAPLPQANGYGTPMMVGQTSQEMNAYDNSKYGYWDARVLALFWGSNIGQAKAFIGSEVMAGGPSPASVDQKLTIARDEAMKQAQQLRLYHETYNFNDAQDLAKFWGLANPFDAKVRMEQKLMWGDEQLISDSLRQARVNTAPPPQNPPTKSSVYCPFQPR